MCVAISWKVDSTSLNKRIEKYYIIIIIVDPRKIMFSALVNGDPNEMKSNQITTSRPLR